MNKHIETKSEGNNKIIKLITLLFARAYGISAWLYHICFECEYFFPKNSSLACFFVVFFWDELRFDHEMLQAKMCPHFFNWKYNIFLMIVVFNHNIWLGCVYLYASQTAQIFKTRCKANSWYTFSGFVFFSFVETSLMSEYNLKFWHLTTLLLVFISYSVVSLLYL